MSEPIRPDKPPGLIHHSIFGSAVMVAGSGGRLALQFIMLAVLARLLTPSDFGLVGATTVIMGVGEILVTVGFGAALVQRPQLRREHIQTAFTTTIFLGIALTFAVFTFAESIAVLFRIPELTAFVRIGSLMLVIKSCAVVAQALLMRNKRFRELALILFLSNFCGLVIVGLPLALAGFGPWSLIAATLVTAAVTTCAQLILQPHEKRPQLDPQAAKELLRYGGGHSIAAVCNSISRQIDNFVVGRVLGAEALGLYGRAYQIMSLPAILVGDALTQVFFPVFADVQDDHVRLRKGYRITIAAIALGVAPTSALFAVLAPELVRIVLGPSWDTIIVPLQILSAAMIFRVGQKLSDSLVKAKAAVYRRAMLVALFAVTVFGAALIGTRWGLPGVAVGIMLAMFAYYVATGVLAAYISNIPVRVFVGAHTGGAVLSILVIFCSQPAAEYLRGLSLGPVVTILGTTLATALVVLLVLRLAPRIALGRDGMDAFTHLFGAVPRLCGLQRLLIPALGPT